MAIYNSLEQRPPTEIFVDPTSHLVDHWVAVENASDIQLRRTNIESNIKIGGRKNHRHHHHNHAKVSNTVALFLASQVHSPEEELAHLLKHLVSVGVFASHEYIDIPKSTGSVAVHIHQLK